MWTTTYEKPKKLVRVAGVWVDPAEVIAVWGIQKGIRVFLSSGEHIDIRGTLSSDDFVKAMSKTAREAE